VPGSPCKLDHRDDKHERERTSHRSIAANAQSHSILRLLKFFSSAPKRLRRKQVQPITALATLRSLKTSLAGRLDWDWLDGEIAPLYSDKGRPGIETRFVIGLLLLKHIIALSDEGMSISARNLSHGTR